MVNGNYLSAWAKELTARLFLPWTFLANSSTARAILNSEFPPPNIIFLSSIVFIRAHNTSWIDRSASSNKWLDEPLKTIEQASPYLQPENLISLSSPIITSSIF